MGQGIVYSKGAGALIGGLRAGVRYSVITTSRPDTIQLAEKPGSVAIVLTAAGSSGPASSLTPTGDVYFNPFASIVGGNQLTMGSAGFTDGEPVIYHAGTVFFNPATAVAANSISSPEFVNFTPNQAVTYVVGNGTPLKGLTENTSATPKVYYVILTGTPGKIQLSDTPGGAAVAIGLPTVPAGKILGTQQAITPLPVNGLQDGKIYRVKLFGGNIQLIDPATGAVQALTTAGASGVLHS